MFSKIVVFVVCVALVHCTDVRECEKGELPSSVEINNCVSEPCDFPAGTQLDANITFDAPYDIEKMETSIMVSLGDLSFPYPVDSDTCSTLTEGYCPLKGGKRAVYNFKFALPSILPRAKVQIELTVKAVTDEGKEELVCFQVSGIAIPDEKTHHKHKHE